LNQVFGKDDWKRIKASGSGPTDVARAFERAFKRAREDVELAQSRFDSICEDRGNGHSYLKDDNSQSQDGATAELAHAKRNLNILRKRIKIFIKDPITYRICDECGKKIPLKRQREVPVTQHCVKCKNGK
jgi:RNA polymerase-binding transcription factor DksA